MHHHRLTLTALLATMSLAVPATALAQEPAPTPAPTPTPAPAPKQAPTPASCKAQKAKSKRLPLFVFKGVYTGKSAIRVTSGNIRTRRAGFLRKRVTFDASCATIRSGNGDADVRVISIDDLRRGDVVTFEARLSSRTRYKLGRVLKATRAINHTNKPRRAPATPAPAPAPAPAPPAGL